MDSLGFFLAWKALREAFNFKKLSSVIVDFHGGDIYFYKDNYYIILKFGYVEFYSLYMSSLCFIKFGSNRALLLTQRG